jgi:hypothetical protein
VAVTPLELETPLRRWRQSTPLLATPLAHHVLIPQGAVELDIEAQDPTKLYELVRTRRHAVCMHVGACSDLELVLISQVSAGTCGRGSSYIWEVVSWADHRRARCEV